MIEIQFTSIDVTQKGTMKMKNAATANLERKTLTVKHIIKYLQNSRLQIIRDDK